MKKNKFIFLILLITVIVIILYFLISSQYKIKENTSKKFILGGKYWETPVILSDVQFEGNAKASSDGFLLKEDKSQNNNGSAFIDASFIIDEEDVIFGFSYNFLNPGDGDELKIWIDDKSRYTITGEIQGTGEKQTTSAIDLSNLEPGKHFLTIALHGFGKENAEVLVKNLTMLSCEIEKTNFYGRIVRGCKYI